MPFSAGTRTSSVSPQKNLESVVTYFKERFSETSQDFVQKEREYLIKAFGNVAYSVGNVASKFVEVMEEQECELSSLDIELRTVSASASGARRRRCRRVPSPRRAARLCPQHGASQAVLRLCAAGQAVSRPRAASTVHSQG